MDIRNFTPVHSHTQAYIHTYIYTPRQLIVRNTLKTFFGANVLCIPHLWKCGRPVT